MNFQKEGKKNTFFNIKKTKKKTCSICTKDTAGRREKRDEQKARIKEEEIGRAHV